MIKTGTQRNRVNKRRRYFPFPFDFPPTNIMRKTPGERNVSDRGHCDRVICEKFPLSVFHRKEVQRTAEASRVLLHPGSLFTQLTTRYPYSTFASFKRPVYSPIVVVGKRAVKILLLGGFLLKAQHTMLQRFIVSGGYFPFYIVAALTGLERR